MARIQDVVFDCAHPASLARFWAATLDNYQVAPYDEAELRRLRDEGIEDPEDDPTVLVEAGQPSHHGSGSSWFPARVTLWPQIPAGRSRYCLRAARVALSHRG